MKKREIFKLSVLLTLAALILSACVAPAQPTQMPATTAPEETVAPTATPSVATEPGATTEPTAGTPGEPTEPQEDWRSTDPYAPYPETVTVTMVKGGQEGASLLPEGETIEDNRAIQYIEDTLNIDITYTWVVPSDSFGDKLNLSIASGEVPDVMIVNPIQLQQLTAAGVIEEMTPYFEQYANADIQENYEQTKGIALQAASIDGKIMGIPNVGPQDDAPLMVWVRQDWLDKLGLEGPKTIDDVEALARAFIDNDASGKGTIGLAGTLNRVGIPADLHGFGGVFNAYGAHPTLFYRDDAGQVVYGSIQPETKEALARLAQWYKDGLIDFDFATKNTDQANELVISGQVGMVLGPWWISWWPLVDSLKIEPEANWQPYMLQANEGDMVYSMNPFTAMYVVVRKGYEHPEVALKILNVQNDLSYGFNNAPQYYPNFNEIWGTLFPLPFLIEQPYVVQRMAKEYNQAVNGELDPATFSDAMKVEFEQIETDIANPRSDPAAWATRMARLDAALMLADGYAEIRSDPQAMRIYPEDPAWPSLEKLESEAFLQIITGAQPIDYFDSFVQQWMNSGGEALLATMNSQ